MENQKKMNVGGIAGDLGDLSFGLKFINPTAIIDMLEVKTGMFAGDFGCGTGYFTFPLAQKVEQNGKVYALDILKEKLEAIESEAKVLGLSNIITRRANLELVGGSKLDADSLDLVCLVNMLFQNKDKNLIIGEAVRVLKKGGKILVVEWNVDDSSFGPESDLRISKEDVFALAESNGLSVFKEIKISDFHFGIILEK
ncbi:MAG: class I SAM-dependent methyltransferase, partial [Candidatus Moraniibacteriota bacterium]